MKPIGARSDGGAPMVVDEEQGLGSSDGFDGCMHLALDGFGVAGLESQLNRGDSCARHASDPLRVGKHGVEAEVRGALGERVVSQGRWERAHAEVGGVFGPRIRIERTGALRLCAPCVGEAFGVDFDEAERGTSLLRAAIHGIAGREGRCDVGSLSKARRVRGDDGLRDVVGVSHCGDGVHCIDRIQFAHCEAA